MRKKRDLAKLAARAVVKDQYKRQLNRVTAAGEQIDCIDDAVKDVLERLNDSAAASLVVYGDPQSGKTEMMICLTAALLDAGYKTIVHLLNDSVDLLSQNLERFMLAGLAPAPRHATDLTNAPITLGHSEILFCKKNPKDLDKLIAALKRAGPIIVVDDEADYATPNAKVNRQQKTRINDLVSQLLGMKGKYIGVTATPARLNLNNTFNTRPETWVQFRPHNAYTGQDHFFPQSGPPPYRLTRLVGAGTREEAHQALARFLVTVAYLNTTATAAGDPERNFSMLVHTSGKTDDHKADRRNLDSAITALKSRKGRVFESFVDVIYDEAERLYAESDSEELTEYVVANASRSTMIVLNSKRDRAAAGDKPTVPKTPFTIIIGGNIVSRGVTFPNLLSMFFTRDVASKLQQDTYIQRARMFGARGNYLTHFELAIPARLYGDWHRCFVFHRLALQTIKNNKVSPVWVGDRRISIVSSSSIDRGTVDLNKGEMSFQMFDCVKPEKLDDIVNAGPSALTTLKRLAATVGDALPRFFVDYIETALSTSPPGSLAIHTSSSIENYGKSADLDNISRTKGFIGRPQLEEAKFPNAVHHVKILHNGRGKARVFYKNQGTGVQFVQNQR